MKNIWPNNKKSKLIIFITIKNIKNRLKKNSKK